jgi:hypothetical protein
VRSSWPSWVSVQAGDSDHIGIAADCECCAALKLRPPFPTNLDLSVHAGISAHCNGGPEGRRLLMGRWFGFRPGYRDLIRVFLGVREGRERIYLVSQFKDVCRMEERFRDELKRYVRRSDDRAPGRGV